MEWMCKNKIKSAPMMLNRIWLIASGLEVMARCDWLTVPGPQLPTQV